MLGIMFQLQLFVTAAYDFGDCGTLFMQKPASSLVLLISGIQKPFQAALAGLWKIRR